jgi:protein-S-isoprenylcysteine O-methyltransferase Ste14
LIADFHYAWRGWILGALFLILAAARWHSPAPLLPGHLFLAVLGAAYRFHAGRFIPGHSNHAKLSGTLLAFRGPYSIGRHPLYLSNMLVIIGLVLFANCLPWPAEVLLLLAAGAHHDMLARAEERFLARSWGPAYEAYAAATPRWLGKPRASRPPSPGDARASAAPQGFGAAWQRQGANLGKTAACILILWALAGFPR